MILNPLELTVIGPVLAMLEANEDLYICLGITATDVRKIELEVTASGILVREFQTDGPPIFEFYARPMGLAMAYKYKKLEDLLYR